MTRYPPAAPPAGRSGAEYHDARLANRNKILRSLIGGGPATRAELSRRTGLSRPTVSVITSDLIEAGLVTEGERVSSGGAPGTLLHIAHDSGVTVVADMRQPRHVTVATVAAGGDVISRTERRVSSGNRALAAIAEHAATVDSGAAIGTTLAVRSSHDRATVGFAEELRREVPMPVAVVGAVGAMAVADLRDSPEGLTGHATLVFPEAVAGLVVNGDLVTGRTRTVGDFSHVATGVRGPTCHVCGRACLSAQAQALVDKDTSANRRRLGVATAAIIAPVAAAIELQEIALAGIPEPAAQAVANSTLVELQERLPGEDVPAVRLSQQGGDAVLVGAAAITLFSRLG